MFLARRPSQATIEGFIQDSGALQLSYEPAEVRRAPSTGWSVDVILAPIGIGRSDFERARTALRNWKQFDLGWVELFPARAPVEVGSVVAVLVRHIGFWSLNGCRVVAVTEDQGPHVRFCVAYGTLTNHAESGEERFEVSMGRDSGEVTFRIDAVSQPRAALAYLGYPLVRHLQARFREDSVEAMKRAMVTP